MKKILFLLCILCSLENLPAMADDSGSESDSSDHEAITEDSDLVKQYVQHLTKGWISLQEYLQEMSHIAEEFDDGELNKEQRDARLVGIMQSIERDNITHTAKRTKILSKISDADFVKKVEAFRVAQDAEEQTDTVDDWTDKIDEFLERLDEWIEDLETTVPAAIDTIKEFAQEFHDRQRAFSFSNWRFLEVFV